MDPVMGIVGMLIIANWSWNLVRISGAVLPDTGPEDGVPAEIARRLEAGSEDRISDLHLWRVGPGHNAAVVSLVSHRPAPPASYKERLAGIAGLSHVTIEVLTCPGKHSG
jgi:Co/Zn/Cd efflux system component